MGSVKDLDVLKPPTAEAAGLGRFRFSDRYSVFDWGEMPDTIPRKGEALALIGAFFFELMEREGITHHYRGLVEKGDLKHLEDLHQPSRLMEVRLFRVVKPEENQGVYDYRVFQDLSGNFLIPLEVIYRHALPVGSSVYRRIDRGEIYWEDLGLSGPPESEWLPHPVLDFSTKLEPTDRYLRREEALQISGLTPQEFRQMEQIAQTLAHYITQAYQSLGIVNLDGKFEFALDEDRNLVVIDVVGTPDECRLAWKDIPLSKEILRMYYRTTVWYRQWEKAKKQNALALRKEIPPPPPLPESLRETVSQMYQSVANRLTGKPFFNVPPYEEVLSRLDKEIRAIPSLPT